MMHKSGHYGIFNNLWLKHGWMLSANINVAFGLSYQQNCVQHKTHLLLTRVLLRSAFSSEISSSLSNSCSRHALSSLVSVANSCKTIISSTIELGFYRFCLNTSNAIKIVIASLSFPDSLSYTRRSQNISITQTGFMLPIWLWIIKSAK